MILHLNSAFLSGIAVLQGRDSLPTAQTCFFQLQLPQYSSMEVMAEKLRYAIRNCRSIDMDTYMLRRNTSQHNVDDDDEDDDDDDDDDDEDLSDYFDD